MSISGTYYLKKRLPDPKLVHGPDFDPSGFDPSTLPVVEKPQVSLPDHGPCPADCFEADVLLVLEARPDGTLTGTADGSPITWGYYTGDEFFKVAYPAGPGAWELWARVGPGAGVEGMVSLGGNGGFPNLAYGVKLS